MKPTIGRIVEFFPNGNEEYKLPNGMETAPAMILQVHGDLVNLIVFCADPDPSLTGTFRAWSISHKSVVVEDRGTGCWDWFKKEE